MSALRDTSVSSLHIGLAMDQSMTLENLKIIFQNCQKSLARFWMSLDERQESLMGTKH